MRPFKNTLSSWHPGLAMSPHKAHGAVDSLATSPYKAHKAVDSLALCPHEAHGAVNSLAMSPRKASGHFRWPGRLLCAAATAQ